MHPRLRPYLGAIALSLSLIPAGMEFYGKQSAIAEDKNTIEQVQRVRSQAKMQTQQDIQIALDRAETGILIDERYPLIEGANAFYDATGRVSKRLLPKGTVLVSAASGFTAEVNSRGHVSDIVAAPPEKIQEVLKQRGVIK